MRYHSLRRRPSFVVFESVVIGLTLLEAGSVSVAMLVAVFLSNLPEAVAATSGLVASGWRRAQILWLWIGVAGVSGLASVAGYTVFDSASPSVVAFVLAFAGGAILTMLADTMMPEAFEHGGKLAGVLTTVGTFVVFAMTSLDRGSTIALVATIVLATLLDLTWKRIRRRREAVPGSGAAQPRSYARQVTS